LFIRAERLFKFLQEAFEFREVIRHLQSGGKIIHAELMLGNSMFMLSEAGETYPPNPTMIHLFLNECDSFYKRALDAGASSIAEPNDQEYGHRSAGVWDSSGNQWWIACAIKS
jgi:PhnB protein